MSVEMRAGGDFKAEHAAENSRRSAHSEEIQLHQTNPKFHQESETGQELVQARTL
jgi:hypothetical protein